MRNYSICVDCNKNIGKYQRKRCNKCDIKNKSKLFTKENNIKWSGGKGINTDGYVVINKNLIPKQYQYLVRGRGDVLEHRLIMAKKRKRKLLNTDIIHHLNGTRSDNRIENLVIVMKGNHEKNTLLKLAQKRIKELEKKYIK